jgi:protein-tyrosine kinase
VSLIERAIKRMDEVPAAPFRQEPHALESQDDGEAFAESYLDGRDPSFGAATDGASDRHIQPVPSSEFPREPQLRTDFAAADDEWAVPKAPAAAGYDGAKPFVARSKTVTIDLQRLREGGMIAPDGDKTPLAEEFRVIKRPLLKNAFGAGSQIRNGNLIMVTSAFPREGKSFCAINLAMSIAMERDRTVLLVDADVARPSIPQKFGIAPDVGLMDVLLDSHVSLSDAIVRTNVNKLALLPAGRPHRQATELLASEAMANLLAEVSERYSDRIVIFDSPPLLVTTEARTLAANMGQIVMVVESDSTTHEALREALSTIESCDVVGMVLNKGRRSNPGDSYGYYGY